MAVNGTEGSVSDASLRWRIVDVAVTAVIALAVLSLTGRSSRNLVS